MAMKSKSLVQNSIVSLSRAIMHQHLVCSSCASRGHLSWMPGWSPKYWNDMKGGCQEGCLGGSDLPSIFLSVPHSSCAFHSSCPPSLPPSLPPPTLTPVSFIPCFAFLHESIPFSEPLLFHSVIRALPDLEDLSIWSNLRYCTNITLYCIVLLCTLLYYTLW